MLNEKILLWKVRNGCRQSMRRIYVLHKDRMLTLANALLNDKSAAEDVVHDVFVSFAESVGCLKLRKSLKGYLAISVRNRAYDHLRSQKRFTEKTSQLPKTFTELNTPETLTGQKEVSLLLRNALEQLPYDQREAVMLHIHSGLTFKKIADMQKVPLNTAQGRYRYGLKKLRSLLNGEVEK